MEAKELYQYMFCENCGKCKGNNIQIVEDKQEKLKIIKCGLKYQNMNEYNEQRGGTNEQRNS